jgi:glycosyltransferase involved in cell wall biosynthesis
MPTTSHRIEENQDAARPPATAVQPRILIFIVAYNAKTTLGWVLDRIPDDLRRENVEVLVIDDSSPDETFQAGVEYAATDHGVKITILRNPENQGYGGNQKLGYRYAIEHGFDFVALVHGDGQYAPECLPQLLAPLMAGEAEAVFGSRLLTQGGARRGGMPLYKLLGNRALTRFQNALLGTNFSEFHSGYRLYSTRALQRIPFECNTNDFHFDTEIIIQLVFAGQRILELPIPTYYGDEVCRVNGLKYAWDVCKTMLRARIHHLDLLYDRKFDVGSLSRSYALKLGYPSSHTFALECAHPGSEVLNIGCAKADLTPELARRGCQVTNLGEQPPAAAGAEPFKFIPYRLDAGEFPVDVSHYDQILLLDVVEQLEEPEHFFEELRFAARQHRPEVLIAAANVGFIVTRLMLLFGSFNYGRRGILDRGHRRLYTFHSLTTLLSQCGYQVLETRGVPAPFPLAAGTGWLSRALLHVNEFLIWISRGLFSYQIFIRAQALPSVHHLLEHTVETSEALRAERMKD